MIDLWYEVIIVHVNYRSLSYYKYWLIYCEIYQLFMIPYGKLTT